ncbi:MAG: N-acetyltransferase [Planctomycetota bacterium]
MALEIQIAESPADMAAIRGLFVEYAESLGFSLCFQGFDRELADLPGCYAAPRGSLRLALIDGIPAGCVAVRPLDDDICEMKRLYVKPAQRRSGLGRRLVDVALQDARRIGYRVMRLDTLSTMTAAIALYHSVGFRTIPAYYENPIESAVYLECSL